MYSDNSSICAHLNKFLCLYLPQISRHVEDLGNGIRNSIIEELSQCVNNGISMTTDIWTDNYRRVSYLSLTLHYVIKVGTELVHRNQLAALAPMDPKKKSPMM